MDETRLANALVLALRGVGAVPGVAQPGMVPGMPMGAVPQGVYTDVSASLRTDLGEARAELREARAHLDTARNGLSEARSQRDAATSKYESLKDRYDEVRAELAALKANPPKHDGKPEWAYALEAVRPRDEGIKTADLMALQRDFTLALEKTRAGGGTAEAIATFNAVVEMVGKVQKTAGVGGAGGGDNLDRMLNIFDKGATIVERRQRMAHEQRAGSKREADEAQGAQGPQGTKTRTPQDDSKAALDTTIGRVVAAFRRQEPAEKVARMLAAAVVWAGELDFAASDAEIRGFLADLLRTPEQTLVWYGKHQEPPVPEDYCRQVAALLRAALNQPAAPTPPAPVAGTTTPAPPTLAPPQQAGQVVPSVEAASVPVPEQPKPASPPTGPPQAPAAEATAPPAQTEAVATATPVVPAAPAPPP